MNTCYQSVMGFKQLESEVPVEESCDFINNIDITRYPEKYAHPGY